MLVAAFVAVAMLVVEGRSLAHPTQADAASTASEPAIEVPLPSDKGEARPVQARNPASLPESERPAELSIAALFRRADIVVQSVMGALALASVACWAVFLRKLFEVASARRRLVNALGALENCRFLGDDAALESGQEAVAGSPLVGRLIEAAVRERQMSEGLVADTTIIDRCLMRAGEIVRDEARRVAAGTGLLATIGAIAPFIGLFGTVWGIMNSFIGISRAQSTNLAIVAPGIAEALLATAMGLVAAIPAVIFYNLVARMTKTYIELAGEGSGMVVRLLSRELARPDRHFVSRAAE